jgi:tRNA pseudouridine38-40 synthase
MRIAAILEYDGSAFSGWQRQDHERSVQQSVEDALSKVANEAVQVTTAGRTDTGVHALAQVIHFDTSAERSTYSWVRGANTYLPEDVSLLWAGQVAEGFHARFGATGRYYRYVIFNRSVRPTTLRSRVSWEYRPLDAERMQAGARHLVGSHDFTSFRASECQAHSPVRELRALTVTRDGDFVHIQAYANAFLHHMVRNIAGVLMQIGAGEREPEWAAEVLSARDRKRGGVTAPPHGLYLTRIEYPAEFALPPIGSTSAFWR